MLYAKRPLLGGVLTDPAMRWPMLFSSGFWREYPYFLPCVAAASYSASAMVLSGVFLKEVCSFLFISFLN